MLIGDGMYKRVPHTWLWMGTAFLVLGFAAGPDFKFFWAAMALGILCLLRGAQIQRSRKSLLNKTQIMVLSPAKEQPTESRNA